jgi:hypothetical protein
MRNPVQKMRRERLAGASPARIQRASVASLEGRAGVGGIACLILDARSGVFARGGTKADHGEHGEEERAKAGQSLAIHISNGGVARRMCEGNSSPAKFCKGVCVK